MCRHDLSSPVQQLNGTTPLSSKGEVYRGLKGTLVRFGPGAEVSSVDFSSDDYHEVQVSCEQQACVARRLQDHLATLGEIVPNSCVTCTEGPEGTCRSIHIRVKNKHHAEALKAKLESDPSRHIYPKLKVDIKDGLLGDSSTSGFSNICFQSNSVRCYWPRPSQDALLYFDTVYQAKEAERILRDPGIRIHGRRINARYEALHRRLELPGVRIRYLDINASYQAITNKLPTNVQPSAVKLGNASYQTAFSHVERAMRNLLSRYGPTVAWEVTEKCNYRDSRAIVRFEHLKDAQAAARELEGYRLPEIGHSELRMRRHISLQFQRIPGSVFNLLKEEVDKLREDLYQAGQVRMEIGYELSRCQREFVNVQLSGRHALSIAKAKSTVENLLAGELAMWGSSKLWDDWFAKSKGSIYFADLSTICGGFVRVDVNTEQIFLYGSAQVKEGMRKAIKAILNKFAVQERQGIVLQDREPLARAVQGTYRRIFEVTGQQSANMYAGSSTKTINLKNNKEVSDNAISPSYEPKPRIHEDNKTEPDCLICLTPASDPFQTTCGHIYCKSCFAHQCSAATSNGIIPIRCLGDSGNCSHIFTVEELKTHLTHESFEHLLETSLAQYVRSNSKSFRHCPTPDCPSIYRLTTERDKLLCHSCLNIICISCQVQDHSGKSCEAYQAAMKAEETFTKWKKENNVNECSRCDAPIEKTDGCNHVECTNCANHMCWQCMASFPTGPEVYKHMREEHGTFMPAGEGWQEDEEGDDDDEDEQARLQRDFQLAIEGFDQEMVFARPNRQLPNLDYALNHQEHEQNQAIQAPQPPLAPADILPWFRARMEEDPFFENIVEPAPPVIPPPQAPPAPPRRRRPLLGNAMLNWFIHMFVNNIPNVARPRRHYPQPPEPAPGPPAALVRNTAPVLEREEFGPESDSDSDFLDEMETASERSHPSENDDDENIYIDERDLPRLVEDDDDNHNNNIDINETPPPPLVEVNDNDDATSTEAEEELEKASTTDSDSDTGPGTDDADRRQHLLRGADWGRYIDMAMRDAEGLGEMDADADVDMGMDGDVEMEMGMGWAGDLNMDVDGDGVGYAWDDDF